MAQRESILFSFFFHDFKILFSYKIDEKKKKMNSISIFIASLPKCWERLLHTDLHVIMQSKSWENVFLEVLFCRDFLCQSVRIKNGAIGNKNVYPQNKFTSNDKIMGTKTNEHFLKTKQSKIIHDKVWWTFSTDLGGKNSF